MLMIKKYSQLVRAESIEKSSIELSCSDENSTELIMCRYENNLHLRQLLVCNIPSFARLFVMTSASICACNPTKLRA